MSAVDSHDYFECTVHSKYSMNVYAWNDYRVASLDLRVSEMQQTKNRRNDKLHGSLFRDGILKLYGQVYVYIYYYIRRENYFGEMIAWRPVF